MLTANEEKILNRLSEVEKAYDSIGEPGFSDANMNDIFELFPNSPAQSVIGVLGNVIKKNYVYMSDGIYYLTAKGRKHFNMEEI